MAQMLNHEESRKPNNTHRRARRRAEVTPNITVNSSSGFQPSVYPSATTRVSPGSSINFQAAGTSAVDFYVFVDGALSMELFGGNQPYCAGTAPNGTSYTVRSDAEGKIFTLSLNSTITHKHKKGNPQDGEIRVGT